MQLNDHSLRQLDAAALERLGEAALRALSVKLLEDLKEARERLNQNSQNSSRPPSSEAPWEKPKDQGLSEDEEEMAGQGKSAAKADKESPVAGEEQPSNAGTAKAAENSEPKRAGKVAGSPGHGRQAPERIDAIELHAPDQCAVCNLSLAEREKSTYTGYYEVDFVRDGTDWRIRYTLHHWQEAECACGHCTRAQPPRWEEDGVELGGFRLIGPGLATLIVALSLRYRLSRTRIREFLGDWLGIWLSVGAIHAAIEEAGVMAAPAEAELIEAVLQGGLLHADETPWPEQGAKQISLWLWVFIGAKVTLYFISHRGQELVRNLLEGYTGVLMSDGWQAYRWLDARLRCWAHLKRKAVGLTESLDSQAQSFGQEVLALWTALQDAVHLAREGPPGSIRSAFDERLAAFRHRREAMRASPHKKTRELAGEFLNDWDAIFAVLDNPLWPLTNNEAERALRHWVIPRKLTHGTRTDRGSRGLAVLASIIDTCRQRGHSPWDYLHSTIVRRWQNLLLLPLPV